jgi:hypothetical protein
VAAHRWLDQLYRPTVQRLREALGPGDDDSELYCQVLEHKWYASERARKDVGLKAALEEYLQIRQEPQASG